MLDSEFILVTGATGYIGGRLIRRLRQQNYRIRCLVRDKNRLAQYSWSKDVEIVEGDVLDYSTLEAALEGIDVAYYLIHSMGAGEAKFVEQDHIAANHFGRAAREAGVKRIIYLGGIKPKSEACSKHLESRVKTGGYLRQWGVPVTEFRAGVIVGSGSLSFELIRYLTERIPILIAPKWVNTPTQPIAVRSVLEYLIHALSVQESIGRTFEIGGKDVLTYREMFQIYANVRHLRRRIIDVPFLPRRLSSLWVGLVTPLDSKVARLLIDGLDNDVVVQDTAALETFDIDLLSYEEAVRLALRRFAEDDVETMWTGAVSAISGVEQIDPRLVVREGLRKETYRRHVRASPEAVFKVLNSLGGETGWLYADALWKIRGLLDYMAGGIGMRRTRRSYSNVRMGDTIDFWRVEAVRENRLLRLRAEMKLPGKAWLEYTIRPKKDGGCMVRQMALYEPKGLLGLLYWYLFSLPHRVMFPRMLKEVVRRAETS